MPFHRYTYAQTTAQINLLSELCTYLQAETTRDPEWNAARSIVLTRMKHEIDRLNNLRSKVKAHGQQVHNPRRFRTDA
jgi:hypothetical protein